jgi:hypothetical protein
MRPIDNLLICDNILCYAAIREDSLDRTIMSRTTIVAGIIRVCFSLLFHPLPNAKILASGLVFFFRSLFNKNLNFILISLCQICVVHNIGTFVVIKSFMGGIPLPPDGYDNGSVGKSVSVGQELGDVSPAGSALQGACLPPYAALAVQGNSEQRK